MSCTNTEKVYQSVKCLIPPATQTVKAATLPFTGLNLVILIAAGIILIVLGFSLRRITRRRPIQF